MSRRSQDRRQARKAKSRDRWPQTGSAARMGYPNGADNTTEMTDTDRDQRGRHAKG